ncbi:MAG: hypothetical protein QOI37_1541 [Chloroflexota bacterium]|jgi:putative FmdB family regulatory protein|nr:hypothetical protein [Chloroflexota bacterium]MEA2654314.1 hypothetical protein [Chloroflexota bacterium]
MPLYDYDCAACGRRFEVIHGVHAPGPTTCPLCGKGPVRKAITAAAVHYKGSGWAKKERRATTSGASKSSGDGAGGDDKVQPASDPDSSSRDRPSTADSSSKSESKSTSEPSTSEQKDSGATSRSSRKPAGSDAAKTTD